MPRPRQNVAASRFLHQIRQAAAAIPYSIVAGLSCWSPLRKRNAKTDTPPRLECGFFGAYEYLVKCYLFVDSLQLQRTDAALLRIVVPVPDGVPMQKAEQQLQTFLRDFYPLLNRYLPE